MAHAYRPTGTYLSYVDLSLEITISVSKCLKTLEMISYRMAKSAFAGEEARSSLRRRKGLIYLTIEHPASLSWVPK